MLKRLAVRTRTVNTCHLWVILLFISPTSLLFCCSFLLSAVNTHYIIFTKKNALSENKLSSGHWHKKNPIQYFYQLSKE